MSGYKRDRVVVYVLQSAARGKAKQTYIGMTSHLGRRIRQHNGQLTGGAKYTSKNRPWRILMVLTGLPDRSEALRWEWAMKHRRARSAAGPTNKACTLVRLLDLKRVTKKAKPRSQLKRLRVYTRLTRAQFERLLGKRVPKIKDTEWRFGHVFRFPRRCR